MSNNPECDKLHAVKDKSLLLTEFVDWLESQQMRICKMVDSDYAPYEAITESYEKLFAKFFDIDLDKLEKERVRMLEALRNANEQNNPDS